MLEPVKKLFDLQGPKVVEALKKRNFEAYYCSDKESAVKKILEIMFLYLLSGEMQQKLLNLVNGTNMPVSQKTLQALLLLQLQATANSKVFIQSH